MKLKNVPRWMWLSLRQLVLYAQISNAKRSLERMEHRDAVLDAMLLLLDKDVRAVAFFKALKKTHGKKRNFPHYWPKRDLIRVFHQNGIAIGPVPNYFAAFNQLLDKSYR